MQKRQWEDYYYYSYYYYYEKRMQFNDKCWG